MATSNVGVVVPTIGTRISFLRESLRSIRNAGNCYICVVAENSQSVSNSISDDLFDLLIGDSGHGLAAAINSAIRALPRNVVFVGWLGDDDLLEPSSLELTSRILATDQDTELVYGVCRYLDANGNHLFVNKTGHLAKWIMRFGPQLIPQPGCLFRRSTFEQIGGLDEELKWAFDLDLMIRLAKHGSFRFLPEIVSSYRWHSESLTVGQRRGSVAEASKVRVRHLPPKIRPISVLWEPVIRASIYSVGKFVSRRALRSEKGNL